MRQSCESKYNQVACKVAHMQSQETGAIMATCSCPKEPRAASDVDAIMATCTCPKEPNAASDMVGRHHGHKNLPAIKGHLQS